MSANFGNTNGGEVQRICPAQGRSKAGASVGWGIAPNLNTSFVALSAGTGPSTLVIAIDGLRVGDLITGFSLMGQVESAGNNVTIDASLRKMTSAAADLVDASVGDMTQLVVAADTALGLSNASRTGLAERVVAGVNYYVLVTATTTASTDIVIQGVLLSVVEG